MNWLTSKTFPLGDISKARFGVGSHIQVWVVNVLEAKGTCVKLRAKSPWVSCHVKSPSPVSPFIQCFDGTSSIVQ